MPITLADAIQNLRSELSRAMQAGASEDLRFRLGPIEMEFEIEVGTEAQGKAGIKWWIIEAGGGAKRSSSSTHKIKLRLEPLTAMGSPVDVSNTGGGKPK